MKILLFSDAPLFKLDDTYYSSGSWIRFPAFLSEQCSILTLFSPVFQFAGDQPIQDQNLWPIDLKNMTIYNCAPYHGMVDYYKQLIRNLLKWRKEIKLLIKSHDAIVMRMYSPMVGLVCKIALKEKKPFFPIIGGDIDAASDLMRTSKLLKKVIYKTFICYCVINEKRWCSQAAHIFVYSSELAQRHKRNAGKISLVRTPHLSMKEITYRSYNAPAIGVRIVRLSKLQPVKGLDYLLKAVRVLISKGYPGTLLIIGKEIHPGYENKLRKLCADLNISQNVTFTGWVPFLKVKELLLKSDIQVISSLSEGTPRAIAEGAACGLPLVSTTVGGCRDILVHEHTALLIPPADEHAIASAVERLIKDKNLRNTLIKNGYVLAEQSTFENLGMKIFQTISQHVLLASKE